MTEVCLAVGCSSLGSFSSRFTELAGAEVMQEEELPLRSRSGR